MRHSRFASFTWALLAGLALAGTVTTAEAAPGHLCLVQADPTAVPANTTVTVVEIDKAIPGTTYATFAVPGTGANAIRMSQSATSTGYAANSSDGTLFAFTGANSTNTAANVNTLNPRTAVTLDNSGSIVNQTSYTGGSGNQTRCATSLDNLAWYIADQGGLYTNGSIIASPSGNFRAAKAFGTSVYVGQASGTSANIQVGTINAPSGGAFTGLPGLTNNANHQDFYLIRSGSNGLTFDVLYTLSATSNTAGTINKYSLVSGSWTANGSAATSFGGFGLAAEANGIGGAFLYVSTGQGALTANQVLRLTDSAGYNAPLSLGANLALFTAPAGAVVKGVAFSPALPPPAPPTQLAVTSVNGGLSPSVNAPFPVVIQAQTATSVAANVLTNTNVSLSLFTGSGALGGTLTGTIPAGQNSVTLPGVTYNVAENGVVVRATRTSGDVLLPGNSAPFNVLANADHLTFTVVPATGTYNVPLASVSVAARRADNSVDGTYTGTVTIANNSGPGTLSGTLSVAAVSGVATFSNLVESVGGVYTLSATAAGLMGDTSTSIRVSGLEEVLLPQFIQGNNGSVNTDRVPFAFRVRLTFLAPNATYRYFNQVVLPTDAPNVSGAGNCIFPSASGFVRTTNPAVTTAGNYAEFTTDANGSATLWLVTEPSGNARFVFPNVLLMRLMLNDGAGGTSITQRISTTNTVAVRKFGSASTEGTGIRGNSGATAKNFVFLYDQTAGAGRPVGGTFVESDGTVNSTGNSYTPFYPTSVDGVAGAWGTMMPNDLSGGVKRIEARRLTDGTIEGCAAIDDDGVWPSGANTVNTSSGLTPVVITFSDAPFNSVPNAQCRATTAQLDATGAVTVNAADVDNGSSDACGIASLTVTPNFFTCASTGPNSVTLNLTNTNGVSTSCSAVVTVVDSIRPTILGVGAGATIDCPAAPVFSTPTAADNCSATLTFSDTSTPTPGCAGAQSVTRTWVATDPSGNSTTASETIVVRDVTPPSIALGASNMTVDCDGAGNTAQLNAWLANHGGASATDACSSVTWSNNFTALSDLCGATGAATVTFTATDGCGNSSTTTATFRVADMAAPVFSAQPQIDGRACNAIYPADGRFVDYALSAMGAVAVDACSTTSVRIASCASSQPEVTGNDLGADRDCIISPDGQTVSMRAERDDRCRATGHAGGDGVGRTYTIVLSATDACGNVATSAAAIVCVPKQKPSAYRSGVDVVCAGSGTGHGTGHGSGTTDCRADWTNGTYGVDCGAGCPSCAAPGGTGHGR